MNMKRRIFLISMASWLFWSPINAVAAGVFTVVTKPKLGFKEGSKTYSLGQSISTFLTAFGPPEKTARDTYDAEIAKIMTKSNYEESYLAYTKTNTYVNDGLEITNDDDGIIKTITFYVIGDYNIKAANVRTIEGIASGASLRDIVKNYGEPFKTKTGNEFDLRDKTVYYVYGTEVLSFSFKDGILRDIGIHAKYLPYLK